MRQLIAILMLLAAGLAIPTAVMADDADDVKATLLAVAAALNAGDAEAYTKHLLPEVTGFFASDGLLTEPWRGELLQSKFDAGLKIDIQLRHLQVKIYDNTAVVTGYQTGVIIFPDGTSLKGPRRISTVWIKQAGQWKLAHIHISFITVPRD